MKNSKLKIILLSLLTLFVLGTAGIYYYASTKITPEKFREMVLQKINAQFPNANPQIGKIDLKFGLSLWLDVSKFTLNLKDASSTDLFMVDDINIKVPVWAIITGGGTVTVEIKSPQLTYIASMDGQNNWQKAMGKTSDIDSKNNAAQVNDTTNTNSENVNRSNNTNELLSKIKLDLKISEMKIHYMLKDDSKGNITLERFLVKGLGTDSVSAFELDSKFDLNLSKENKASFKTLVIGQFNLGEYLKGNDTNSVTVIKLTDLSFSPGDRKIPDTKIDINTKFSKEGIISGTTVFEMGNGKGSFEYEKDKNLISLKKLKMEFAFADLLSMSGVKAAIRPGKAIFKSDGEVSINDSLILPHLKFTLGPDIEMESSGINTKSSIEGQIGPKSFSVESLTKLLEGRVETSVKGDLDINAKPLDLYNIKPLDVDIRLIDLKIPRDMIQKMIYAPAEKSTTAANKQVSSDQAVEEKKVEGEKTAAGNGPKQTTSISKSETNKADPNSNKLIPARVNLGITHLMIDKESISGKGNMTLNGNKVALEKLDFSFAGGQVNFNSAITLAPRGKDVVFNLQMSRINLKGFNVFLPPMLKGMSGLFSGPVNGSAKLYPNSMNYDVAVNVTATGGEIKGLDLTQKVHALVTALPLLKGKIDTQKKYEVDSNFENFSLKGKFSNEAYQIEKVDFVGVNKNVEFHGSGSIYPPPSNKSAEFKMELSDNSGKLSAILEKNIGTKVLPMLLVGPGFELKPDYQYTLTKLAKSGVENKLKQKVKEKVEEKATEKIQEILNDKIKKEGVNKLLRGIFK